MEAPAVSPPLIMSLPMLTLSVSSSRVTLVSLVTSWFPTFSTVTLTPATSPWTTELGALTAVTAMSVAVPGLAASQVPSPPKALALANRRRSA